MANISVIGAGTWGCGLSRVLCANGHNVLMWSPFEEEAANLRTTHIHPNLSNVVLPDTMDFTSDLEKALTDKELIVMAVASPFTRMTAEKMSKYVVPGQRIVTVTKGIEESTLKTQAEILEELLPTAIIGALSGPTHAEEVILGLPTTIVSASENREMAEYVQNVFMAPNFRVYTSPDVLGVELGGSLKNVIALAAGIAAGLGYGDNAMAALITRGIHEMVGLAGRMGASYETLYGLSGIGDLIVTCESKHSRNRKAGVLIGQGMSMQDAMKEVGQVVEGVYSAKAALTLSQKYGVNLPITNEVNKVLFEGKDPGQAVMDLMTRDKKMENFVKEEDLPREWQDL